MKFSVNLIEKQDKLAGYNLVEKSNFDNNKIFIFSKSCTPFKAFILPFIPLFPKDFFIKIMKVFMKSTQV